MRRSEQRQICAFEALRERRSIWCGAPANRLSENDCCMQESISDINSWVAPGKWYGYCSWRLLNALSQVRKRQFLIIVLPLCYAGLQLEVAKCIIIFMRKEKLDHNCYRKLQKTQLVSRSEQKSPKYLGQSKIGPDKWLLENK